MSAPASRADFPAESRADGPFIDVIATQSVRHGSSSGFPTAGTQPCIHEENSVADGVTATGVGQSIRNSLNYSDVIPSCSERVFAASMAAARAARSPPFSSSRRPAAVVPPGEVTIARSRAGDVFVEAMG